LALNEKYKEGSDKILEVVGGAFIANSADVDSQEWSPLGTHMALKFCILMDLNLLIGP